MTSLKVLHTSDWHLGKKLFSASRLDEQSFFLDFLYNKIINQKINLLIIAGDIFDVTNPPHDALKLFYEFIYRLGDIQDFTCLIITGNHDSEALFNIPKDFFKLNNCYIYNNFDLESEALEHYIPFNEKTIGVKLLPYFRNHQLLKKLQDPLNPTPEEIEKYFKSFFSNWSKPADFKILVSHHCFGPYSAAGSEQAIFLSGLDHIPLNWVTPYFDYVALGHIHKKQVLFESPPIVYTGSPYPLRFSESNNKKIAIFECDKELNLKFEDIPLSKKLIQLKTNLKDYKNQVLDIISQAQQDKIPVYLEVIIQLDRPEVGLADEIHSLCLNTPVTLLMISPIFKQNNEKETTLSDLDQLDLNELFINFFKEKFGDQVVPEELIQTFQSLMEESQNEISPNHH